MHTCIDAGMKSDGYCSCALTIVMKGPDSDVLVGHAVSGLIVGWALSDGAS